jgi:hypothetical protein
MDADNKRAPCFWRAATASVRGTSHEKTGQPCQDAHYWEILPEGVLVAAIADGAGSASLGDLGADVAARTAVQAATGLETPLSEDSDGWRSLLTEALRSAREAIYAEATCHEVTERELATTLILVIATPELVAAAQVGDGAAVAGVEGDVLGITVPQTGEYINQTTFLVSRNALNTAQLTVWQGPISHIAILSDGLQMLALKMPEGKPHAPFFSPLFRFIAKAADETEANEQLEAFLRSPRVRERTDDDLTLFLAAFVG